MPINFSLSIPILASSNDWIAVNKPNGIGMHSEDRNVGMVVMLEQQLEEKLWPVHRLDKVTSGVLLLARHAEAATELGQMFERHQLQKLYIAQSVTKPSKKQGLIKGDMEKARNGCWKLTRTMNNPAITRFISSYCPERQRRYFLLKPQTGKTHQLRVALKSLGSPIEGDQRYKGEPSDRTYLHAAGLVFEWKAQRIELLAQPLTGNWQGMPPDWLSQPWRSIGN